MRDPILMLRTALIATIGFFAVCSISHADPDEKPCSDACKQFKQILKDLPGDARSAPKPGAEPKRVPAGTTSRGAADQK